MNREYQGCASATDPTTGKSDGNSVSEHDNQLQFLQSMLDFMPIPAILIRPETSEICFANAAAKETADVPLPRTAPCLSDPAWGTFSTATGEPFSPDDFPSQQVAQDQRLRHFELQWHLPSGVRHLLLSGGRPPPIGNDSNLVVLMFEDVTHQKDLEATLRDENARKDEFLSVLAHELRNPLMPIRNALAILDRAGDRDSAARARAMIDRQVHHMTRLVDNLLDLSRIQRGKLALRKERIELQRPVAKAIETAQPLADAKRQTLNAELPDLPIYLHADERRVKQVVSNLLFNAFNFTPAGGTIVLTAEVATDDAVITVSDDGIGMSQDQLKRVFNTLARRPTKTDSARHGLGVGLALARQLAELHDGRVTANSAGAGQGSKFTLRLPRLPEHEEQALRGVCAPDA